MRCTLLYVSVWELKEDIYKIDVTDQDGCLIATMTGNGFTIELR
jgi:hypothetical protein